MLQAINYENGKLNIIDQLKLPSETCYSVISNVSDGWNAIHLMKVRGAPAIAIVGALSLAVELRKNDFASKSQLNDFIEEKLKYLVSARPTAVNMKNTARDLTRLSKSLCEENKTDVTAMKNKIIEQIENMLTEDIKINRAIGNHGAKYILEHCSARPLCILTHCNTGSLATAGYGTALGVIRSLAQTEDVHVYFTETRPYNQGARLTAYELISDQIPSTLICDNMVAALMKSGKISAVVVGADRIVANGDTANKIGTYQIAVCAKYHSVPFFVAAPRSSIDMTLKRGSDIPIEERPHSEITHIQEHPIAAPGVKCWNPSFDVTPADIITGGIITETGVFAPNKLKECIN